VSVPTHFDRQDSPGAGTFQTEADKLEVAPGRQRDGIEGWVPELANETEVREALEKAFGGATLSASFVRILPKNGSNRVKIAYSDIAALAFSGRDPAAGKSWEAWVKKYWEKKEVGGQGASLLPDESE